jgi:hypothetical protein
MPLHNRQRLLGTLCLLVACFSAVVLAANSYQYGESIPVLLNTIGPLANPSETYEFTSLPLCQPEEAEIEKKPLTLGETIKGDRQVYSLYDIHFQSMYYFVVARMIQSVVNRFCLCCIELTTMMMIDD